MSNIPPPPATPVLNYGQEPRNDLRKIAVNQKAIMYCILAEIMIIVAQIGLRASGNPNLAFVGLILGLVYLATAIVALVFVFMLSLSLYNIAVGIILGLLMFIPLINLLVLLMINGKATKTLNENGIKVGLMGADLKKIPAG